GSRGSVDFERLPMVRASFNGMTAYGQAKLCNVLMAKALHARYASRGLVACALHPGTFVTTDLARHSRLVGAVMRLVSPFTKDPVQGAATSVYATVHEPGSELAGQYLQDCRIARCSTEANDAAVARRLWTVSERWTAAAGAPDWA